MQHEFQPAKDEMDRCREAGEQLFGMIGKSVTQQDIVIST